MIRNLAKEKSADAQILMRNYMMERFLERISLSEYRDNFILKGGMLVAAMVGLDARSTMDLDATVRGASVNVEDIENLMSSIIAVPIEDGVEFQVKSISEIMDEAEYPGIRVSMATGYARWAKVFNLKQMAQTMNYLTEHGLLEYAVLEEKAAAATTRHNELSAQIKAAETRMAEIAVLRTHIINYVKTREVYAAYRKAGYSKKFLAEHEADILLHKAAKQAFDDLGIKKLPTVKSLQAEYAQLLEGKKKDYAEYRRSREEMRELLAAKANVDRLMGYGEERQNDREKEQGQDR